MSDDSVSRSIPDYSEPVTAVTNVFPIFTTAADSMMASVKLLVVLPTPYPEFYIVRNLLEPEGATIERFHYVDYGVDKVSSILQIDFTVPLEPDLMFYLVAVA